MSFGASLAFFASLILLSDAAAVKKRKVGHTDTITNKGVFL